MSGIDAGKRRMADDVRRGEGEAVPLAATVSRMASGLAPLLFLAAAVVWADRRQPPVYLAERRASGESIPGEALYRQRCALCHPISEQGAQGPGLAGVVGRKAATGRGFGYTSALRNSGLTWERSTLERFLSAPTEMVPGTAMPMSISDPDERRQLIEYLSSLRTEQAPVASAPASSGDYRGDAPGVRRRLRLADLPQPYATPSVANGPTVVHPRPGLRPAVPAGFSIEPFAKDLESPRLIRVAPNGDVFVAESAKGQVRVLSAKDRAVAAESVEVFASGLDRPFGIAFFPPGVDPRWVYVANTNSVVRFPYRNGDLRARGAAQPIVARLTETGGGHWTRDVVFSKDGTQMFVSVGSASNVAEGLSTRFEDEIVAWEASHGLGAAWDYEENRADVLVFDPEGQAGRAYATGIRNCVGLAVNPATGDPWCSTNERDGLGDDLVPDYVTRVRERAFYGWPWLYLGDHEDPRHPGARPGLARKVTVPDVLLQAHSAPLGIAFYEGAMFPAAYRGNLFAALHGSWNRASRTGPKVVRVLVDSGVPTGEYEDFVTGFVTDDASVWGRPVGVAVAHDGALLVSEDANGTIWRVAYRGPRPQ
jgi:glucose/arabinose dehydrogenase/cytochrome c2